jgi:hypothetical protein
MPFIEPTPHNQALPEPDRLTTLTMNYLWRRFIADALTEYFERAIPKPSSDPDVQATWVNFHNLILDLYDSEIGLQILRIATVHAEVSHQYPILSTNRIVFDVAETPYYYDPDGLFIVADNVFRAQEAGVYALMLYFNALAVNAGMRIGVRRVGDTDEYAATEVPGNNLVATYGTVVALVIASVGDEFEFLMSTAASAINTEYGYAAFVRLGGL